MYFDPEHALGHLHDATERAKALQWAQLNDPLYAAAERATEHLDAASRMEAMLVAMLAGKIFTHRRMIELLNASTVQRSSKS